MRRRVEILLALHHLLPPSNHEISAPDATSPTEITLQISSFVRVKWQVVHLTYGACAPLSLATRDHQILENRNPGASLNVG
jgi:hypothetical protein